jgi:Tol biopolymer transport system component
VFASHRDGSADLFLINVSGGGLIKLSSNSGFIDEDASYSRLAP